MQNDIERVERILNIDSSYGEDWTAWVRVKTSALSAQSQPCPKEQCKNYDGDKYQFECIDCRRFYPDKFEEKNT